MSPSGDSRIPLQLSRGCVVASVQVDLDAEVLLRFRAELLELLRASGARGIILDLSGVDIMDVEDFQAVRNTMIMARLMGAETILSGLRPGVVSALIDLDADTRGVEAAHSLDDAFERMEVILAPEDAAAEGEEQLDDASAEGELSGEQGLTSTSGAEMPQQEHAS
ncbi:MAG: STAS domain-containing protein [Planctomycetota bacterium]